MKETLRFCPAAPIVVRRLLRRWSSAVTRSRRARPWRRAYTWCTAGPTSTPSRCASGPGRFLERPAGTYTWIPFGGGVRRCLAAPYAQMLMKQVIGTVVAKVNLRVPNPRPERARKSALAFVPHRHALVAASRRRLDRAAHVPAAPRSAATDRQSTEMFPTRRRLRPDRCAIGSCYPGWRLRQRVAAGRREGRSGPVAHGRHLPPSIDRKARTIGQDYGLARNAYSERRAAAALGHSCGSMTVYSSV